jgi:two-component system phosphate regulon sensor histidine kinase PhoR
MKRKISFQFLLIILSALIVFILGASFIAKNSLNNATKLNLEKYLYIITQDYKNLNETQIIDKYQDIEDFLRITFIDSDGTVIADSLADNLDNHINRPEIVNIGDIYIRYSDTLRIDMMYLAAEVDSVYVRVAIPTASVLGFLNDFIALSIVIGIAIVLLSIATSSYLIKQSLKPLQEIKEILRGINQGEFKEVLPILKYDEINSLVKEVNDINQTISSNIASLKSEKLKSDFLLNHMNQGICVLNEDAKIVLLNSYLKGLYNFNIDYNINKDFRYLFRDEEIQKAIKKVYEDKNNQLLTTQIDGNYYSVSIIYSEKDYSDKATVILIYSDITESKNIEILKRDFFVNASHELKSPLTTIIGSADLIANDMASDEATRKDLINRISSEANRMNNLVLDMLALSEQENKNSNKEKKVVNVQSTVEEVINNLLVFAQKNNIEIITDICDANIYINYEEIYQLVKNLLENAIKYNKNKGKVWINVEVDNVYLIISVKDNGIGIPKKDLSRVFERFYRVDKARSNAIGGTGLGLSIVKHIVMNYNGHIELNSSEDDGTEIKIYLPKKELKLI